MSDVINLNNPVPLDLQLFEIFSGYSIAFPESARVILLHIQYIAMPAQYLCAKSEVFFFKKSSVFLPL